MTNLVIVGGGIGGLSVAAGLAPYCDTITLVEKDQRPTLCGPRRYAPQGAHISILLQGGLALLEGFMPGFTEDLLAAGAVRINAGSGQQVFEYGAWRPERKLDLTFMGQSRPLFETVLFQQVTQLQNVTLVNSVASGIDMDDCGQVTSVTLGNQQKLPADIVIDASGVAGVFTRFFQKNAIADIPVEYMPINIFYSTLHFDKPKEYLHRKENILIVPEAGVNNLGASLIDIENDTWCVSLHGRTDAQIPQTIDDWRALVRSLPDNRIWDRIKDATARTELHRFKKSKAVWRRFDQCDQLPLGYIPIGDSINSLNPIFGQGMTVTIGHTASLVETIKEMGLDSSKAFQEAYLARAMKWTEAAWKKTLAFDKNFVADQATSNNRIALVRKFTAVQHKKITECEDFHLKILRESQFLNHQ